MNQSRLAWLLVVLVSLSPSVCSAQDAEVDLLVDSIGEAVDYGCLMEQYHSVFRKRPIKRVEPLRFHELTTIAIRAAWEPVRRSAKQSTEERHALSPRLLERFLGFAEGRIRCEIPGWWQQTLRSALAWREDLDGDEEAVSLLFLAENPGIYQEGPEGAWIPKDMTIEIGDSHYIFKQGGLECRVEQSLHPRKQLWPHDSIVAHFHEGKLFVAFLSDIAGPFRLHRIDCETSSVDWKSEVWASGILGRSGPTGLLFHAMEVVVLDDRVYVFGMGNTSAYIEGFSLRDGTSLFRFDTYH